MTENAENPIQPGFTPSPAPAAPPPAAPLRFTFSGDGAEFFRIWFVNILLSILTLGIYSAWGKVRTQKYLYGHTRFAGSGFDYHGKPLAILKGRALIVGVIVLLAVAKQVSPLLELGMYLGLALFLPWAVTAAMRFRLRNTSWRQMRFNFRATTRETSSQIAMNIVIVVLTLGFGLPYARHRLHQFLVGHSWFGNARFDMSRCVREYYGVWFKGILMAIGASVALVVVGLIFTFGLGIVSGGGKTAFGIGIVLYVVLAYLFLLVMWMSVGQIIHDGFSNAMWNHTVLNSDGRLHRFQSGMTLGGLARLHAGNAILILLSAGFYYPFAKLRVLDYRLSNLTVFPDDNLDAIRARPLSDNAALGDAAADGFELDLGL